MKKITTKQDCDNLSTLPPSVHCVVEEIVAKLNFYYGEHRDVDKDMGGYVLLIESQDDLKALKSILHQPISEVIPEYVDLIKNEKEDYTNSLIICSSDYSISLVIPLSLTPPSFIGYIGSEDD